MKRTMYLTSMWCCEYLCKNFCSVSCFWCLHLSLCIHVYVVLSGWTYWSINNKKYREAVGQAGFSAGEEHICTVMLYVLKALHKALDISMGETLHISVHQPLPNPPPVHQSVSQWCRAVGPGSLSATSLIFTPHPFPSPTPSPLPLQSLFFSSSFFAVSIPLASLFFVPNTVCVQQPWTDSHETS